MKLIIAALILVGLAPVSPVVNDEYVIDIKESVVEWKGSMQFVPANKHNGYATLSRGELMINKGQLVGGTIDVDMNTIVDERHESDNDLIRHLKSPDFFDVKKYPLATFLITGVERVSGQNVNVNGSLTIKDITHSVTFPAKLKVGTGVVDADGTVVIDRTKWDVRYNSGRFFSNLADETISDEIEIHVKIVARKK